MHAIYIPVCEVQTRSGICWHCGCRTLRILQRFFVGFCCQIHSRILWKSRKISDFRILFFTEFNPASGMFRRVSSQTFGATSTSK
jgi:hypothetical protein